jgi:hypothetical protein
MLAFSLGELFCIADINIGAPISSWTSKLYDVPLALFCSFHEMPSVHGRMIHCCDLERGSVGANRGCVRPGSFSFSLTLTSSWCCDVPSLLRKTNVVLEMGRICHESPGSDALKAWMKTAAALVSDASALHREPVKPAPDSVMWYHALESVAKVPISIIEGNRLDKELMLVQAGAGLFPQSCLRRGSEADECTFNFSPHPGLVACFEMKCNIYMASTENGAGQARA